jgi:hypothetical protein
MGDDRFTEALLFDVTAVLTRHGYRVPSGDLAAMAATVAALLTLTEAYEGPPAVPAPLLTEALRQFGDLPGDDLPSVRAIIRTLHVGHKRAVLIRGALDARKRGAP